MQVRRIFLLLLFTALPPFFFPAFSWLFTDLSINFLPSGLQWSYQSSTGVQSRTGIHSFKKKFSRSFLPSFLSALLAWSYFLISHSPYLCLRRPIINQISINNRLLISMRRLCEHLTISIRKRPRYDFFFPQLLSFCLRPCLVLCWLWWCYGILCCVVWLWCDLG